MALMAHHLVLGLKHGDARAMGGKLRVEEKRHILQGYNEPTEAVFHGSAITIAW